MELMIVLAVVGIALAVAIPSFATMRRNARMTGAANDLIAAINLARSEAIKRQVPVAMCGSANPRDADPTCSDTLTGWVVWEDTNNDRLVGADEPVLSSHDALDATLTVSDNFAVISYAATGFPQNLAVPPAILLCDDRGDLAADGRLYRRIVSVSRTGRPAILKTGPEVTAFAEQEPPPLESNCNAG